MFARAIRLHSSQRGSQLRRQASMPSGLEPKMGRSTSEPQNDLLDPRRNQQALRYVFEDVVGRGKVTVLLQLVAVRR
jgi:hypothetical protein